MKYTQKLTWLVLLTLPMLIAISGCKKFLDRKPLGVATTGDITQGGVEGQTFALYGAMRKDGMTAFPMLWFKSIRSDDAQKGSTTGDLADGGAIMDNFGGGAYSKDHWLMNQYWDDHYSFIALCNDVVHEVDSLNLTDPASLTNKAEARFFRAYTYFDLVRDYGEVPIINFKVYTSTQANKPKSTVAQVYAQIDADLAFAEQYLPTSWPAKFVGRLTKGTANSLIAKTLIQRGNWTGALTKAEEIITSGQYALLGNYQNYFKESGEQSSEAILEVEMYENTNGSVYYGNSHNQVQGVRGSGDWDLGWGFNVPTAALEASYETGDPRKDATILYSGQPDNIYGRTVPPSPPLAQPMWNKKVYTDLARQQATGDRFSWWHNIRLMRYSDIILIAAEAANESGNTTKALNYLNQIRARARNGNNAVLPNITSTVQATIRTAIKRERRAEFGMEFERFYDLVRWGDAVAVLGPLGYVPRNQYYPIPQPAIDRSGGTLVQNPLYP